MDMEKFLKECGEDCSLNPSTIAYRKNLLDTAVEGDKDSQKILRECYNLTYIFHNNVGLPLVT